MLAGNHAKKLLPRAALQELKHWRHAHLIRSNKFTSPEQEFKVLHRLIPSGSMAIDVGANVGHYTLLLSKLVGADGRVIAFEPLPKTFIRLARNTQSIGSTNITLFNAAVSPITSEVKLSVPNGNPYRAKISESGDVRVRSISIDSVIAKEDNVAFIKVDAEGHDESVITSAHRCIQKCRPIIMGELSGDSALTAAGDLHDYSPLSLPGSHNQFLVPGERAAEIVEILEEYARARATSTTPTC